MASLLVQTTKWLLNNQPEVVCDDDGNFNKYTILFIRVCTKSVSIQFNAIVDLQLGRIMCVCFQLNELFGEHVCIHLLLLLVIALQLGSHQCQLLLDALV